MKNNIKQIETTGKYLHMLLELKWKTTDQIDEAVSDLVNAWKKSAKNEFIEIIKKEKKDWSGINLKVGSREVNRVLQNIIENLTKHI